MAEEVAKVIPQLTHGQAQLPQLTQMGNSAKKRKQVGASPVLGSKAIAATHRNGPSTSSVSQGRSYSAAAGTAAQKGRKDQQQAQDRALLKQLLKPAEPAPSEGPQQSSSTAQVALEDPSIPTPLNGGGEPHIPTSSTVVPVPNVDGVEMSPVIRANDLHSDSPRFEKVHHGKHQRRAKNQRSTDQPILEPAQYEEIRKTRLREKLPRLNFDDTRLLIAESHFTSVFPEDIGPATTCIAVGGVCCPVVAETLSEVGVQFPNYKQLVNGFGSNCFFHHRDEFSHDGKMRGWVKAVLVAERLAFPNAKIKWIVPFVSRRLRQRRGHPNMLRRLIDIAARELKIQVDIVANIDTDELSPGDWKDHSHIKPGLAGRLMGNVVRLAFGLKPVAELRPMRLQQVGGYAKRQNSSGHFLSGTPSRDVLPNIIQQLIDMQRG